MLACVTLALLAAGEVPFSLKPLGPPGRYELQLYGDARARATLTVTPPPGAPDGARAELSVSADEEGSKWLIAALAKQAPRGAALTSRTRLGGRWKAGAVELDGFSVSFDLAKNEGAFTLPPGSNATRVIEQALTPWPKTPTPLAHLDAPKKVSGPGANLLWSGRAGLLFVEPGGLHRVWEPASGAARTLGKRKTLAPLAACGGGVCAVADPGVTVLPGEPVKLPGRATSLWVSSDGNQVGGELDTGAEGQHLWAWDRKTKRLIRWDGADDLAHQLRFKAWGSKGILFSRTTACIDGADDPGVDEAACLLELELDKGRARLTAVGTSPARGGNATSPDRGFRVATVGSTTVLEALDAGTREVIDVALMDHPVWLSPRVALVAADPLTVLDVGGAVRPVIDDRIQFAGGQLDGAIVWYETADGLFVARVIAQ